MNLMKMTFCLSLILLFYPSNLEATIITVDNSANSSGAFKELPAAINAAAVGDTIHIIGSNTSYGNITISKRLTLLGSGYNPPNQLGLKSQVGTIILGVNSIGNNISSTKISGLLINQITYNFNSLIGNITIERCEITGTISMPNANGDGWTLQNNIINSISINNNASCAIRNNIIKSFISNSNEPSVAILNNLFVNQTNTGNVFANVQHAIIINNIFYKGRSPQGCTLSDFRNNITFLTSNNALPYGNNSGSNNQVNVDPQFANAPNGPFQFDYDYRLTSGSPGQNAATDGTDIGIYGSSRPFPIGGPVPYLTSAPPRVPQVMELNILNSTLPQGTPLNFQVIARKQN